MKRKLLLASIAGLGLCVSAPVDAQTIVTCANCSTLAEQAEQYAEQISQYVEEAATEINTVNILTEEIVNTVKQPATAFRDLTFDVQQIETIAQQANMLTGLAGQINVALNSQGGYPVSGIANWQQTMTNETLAIGNAMKASAQILNLMPTQLFNDAGQLEILNSQNMVNDGRLKAIQTLSSTASQAGQAIQKLQSVVQNNQQAIMTYYSAQEDRAYLSRTVSDHDLEQSWLSNCAAITQLGGQLPPDCAAAQ